MGGESRIERKDEMKSVCLIQKEEEFSMLYNYWSGLLGSMGLFKTSYQSTRYETDTDRSCLLSLGTKSFYCLIMDSPETLVYTHCSFHYLGFR